MRAEVFHYACPMPSEAGAIDPRAQSPETVRALVDGRRWYHTIELAPGVTTPGMFDHRPYVRRYGLPDDLSGLRALDVGTLDGFWAFELERRGAQVTALDLDRPEDLDWPPRLRRAGEERRAQGAELAEGGGFQVARRALGSSVQRSPLSIYDATPDRLGGRFDLVFCGSVLIHLRDPMLALERMAGLCRGRLILAEEYSRALEWVPGIRLAEFRGDSPWMTWWRPSSRTWVAMVRCAGFEDVRRHSRFRLRFRGRRDAVPHTVIHARGDA
jgi:tRNA (mo5U34)-methyltransferase